MKSSSSDIPPARERQFDLISVASTNTLQWARSSDVALRHIEPVVPFVETDFSLEAWLFFDTEHRIEVYRANGTLEEVTTRFHSELASAGYPTEWLRKVACHFGSKEVVDRDYQGSYYYFLR